MGVVGWNRDPDNGDVVVVECAGLVGEIGTATGRMALWTGMVAEKVLGNEIPAAGFSVGLLRGGALRVVPCCIGGQGVVVACVLHDEAHGVALRCVSLRCAHAPCSCAGLRILLTSHHLPSPQSHCIISYMSRFV